MKMKVCDICKNDFMSWKQIPDLTSAQRTCLTCKRSGGHLLSVIEGERLFYLSGPMTGLKDYNFPAFEETKKTLEELGLYVLSPHEVSKQNSWEAYMKTALIRLCYCTDMCMLPGWENSRGAKIEHTIAKELAMPIYYLKNGQLSAE